MDSPHSITPLPLFPYTPPVMPRADENVTMAFALTETGDLSTTGAGASSLSSHLQRTCESLQQQYPQCRIEWSSVNNSNMPSSQSLGLTATPPRHHILILTGSHDQIMLIRAQLLIHGAVRSLAKLQVPRMGHLVHESQIRSRLNGLTGVKVNWISNAANKATSSSNNSNNANNNKSNNTNNTAGSVLKMSVASSPTLSRPPPGFNNLDESSNNSNNNNGNTSSNKNNSLGSIELSGSWSQVQRAYVQCLVWIDSLQGQATTQLSIPWTLLPLLVGPRRHPLDAVARRTVTNIYVCYTALDEQQSSASPLTRTDQVESYFQSLPALQDTLFISGATQAQVLAAKEAIQHQCDRLKETPLHRQVFTFPHSQKMDWLWTNRRDRMMDVMYDLAVSIQVTPLGSSFAALQVMAPSTTVVDKAMTRLLALLMDCHYVHLSMTVPSISSHQWKTWIQKSGADCLYHRGQLHVFGSEAPVQTFISLLSSLSLSQCRYVLEQPLSSREFISGKKEGKINKVTRASHTRIQFSASPHPEVLCVETTAGQMEAVLLGVSLLKGELPAELYFHIPEQHHKRIIGHGGKNIQRIMKRFGVYVKFLSHDEIEEQNNNSACLFPDNVLVRTPAKNAESLVHLKETLLSLLEDPFDVEHWILPLPRSCHVWCQSLLLALQTKCACQLTLPRREWGCDWILVEGRGSDVKEQVREQLQELMPFEVVIPLIFESKTTSSSTLEQWKLFLQKNPLLEWHSQIMQKEQVTLYIPEEPILLSSNESNESSSGNSSNIQLYQIHLTMKSHFKNIPKMNQVLEQFLQLILSLKMISIRPVSLPLDRSKVKQVSLPLTLDNDNNRNMTMNTALSNSVNIGHNPDSSHNQSHPTLAMTPFASSSLSNTAVMSSPLLTSVGQSPLSTQNDIIIMNMNNNNVVNSVNNNNPVNANFQSRLRVTSAALQPTSSLPFASTGMNLSQSAPDSFSSISNWSIMNSSALNATAVNSTATSKGENYAAPSSPRPIGSEAKTRIPLAPLELTLPSSPILSSPLTAHSPHSPFPQLMHSPQLTSARPLTLTTLQPPSTLEALLHSLSLSKYLPLFQTQDVDLEMLKTLTDSELKELGVDTFGARRKILNAFKEA